MYAGKTTSIDIPSVEHGRLITLSNGYIYYVTEFRWDSTKKRTEDNRVGIGKVDPEHPGKMFPNKKYALFFGAPVTEAQVADTIDTNWYDRTKRKEAGKLDFTLSYGPFAVLTRAAEMSGMLNALQQSMPRLWREIFAVALHAVVAEQSTAQSFPGWAFDNWCGLTNSPSDSTISRIYSEIARTPECIPLFFEYYFREFHKAFPVSDVRVVAFDSTNQVTESKNQVKARRGKSKTGEKLPIINTAMFVDEVTHISLWYEHFDGNVLDKSQTPYSIEKAKELGFKKLFAMMDRGYYSESNARKINLLNIEFGMMMPETASIVSDLISKFKCDIKLQEKHYIPEEDIYGIQTTVELSSQNFYAYVFYDDHTATDERNSIHAKVNYFMEEAQKRFRYTEKMKKFFSERGIIVNKVEYNEQTKKNFTLEINNEMVQQAYEESGFFVIISNKLLSAKDMICIARSRDCVEKAYRDLKSHFMLSRTYTHSDETYCGKMFVAFIALIILQSFRWFTRHILRSNSSETISTLLSEMRKYKILEKKDCTWMPVYTMNKKQKEIVKALTLTEEQIEKDVRSLSINRKQEQ